MSGFYVKTKYNTEGSYGSTEENSIYAHHNNSSDYVTIYDSDGTILLVIPDTIDNNILDAICRLYNPILNNNYVENVELLTQEERKKLNI